MDTLTAEKQYYSLCHDASLPCLPIPAVSKAWCAHPTVCQKMYWDAGSNYFLYINK